ncbi:radical SAM family heme chaperone HemW [Sediminibacterium sp.]|uniref:radical SAM family heme chaperone HemW n=1 Tax=Sediminibacterium sp. TaxID=1917865 RepID=UPI00273429E6|nr:radical SAM family heme chaperone HemW [Sediminibacterium sp.]MDP3392370.1 radical SAM family heme chaperone HemW [Sediminibacterium sp.]MDP3566828.1 radical SAM family heme chaperone HemW [Sediminibacterium sp.]
MAGIYIHIPFCKKACNYCNFHFSTNHQLIDQVVEAIVHEIQLQKKYLAEPIETLYLGGGTPSLLKKASLTKIFEAVKQHFNLLPHAEITLEANPDDIDNEQLLNWIELGVNRLSIGIQSFRNEDLQWMGRAHNADQALACIGLAQAAGIQNISIDLIYGGPSLSNKDWIKNLQIAINTGVPHLSCYALTVEPKTALAHKINKQELPNVDAAHQAAHFSILQEMTANAGFEQYEISNFSLPGKRSIHNANYWSGQHYLGIGPAAHSFNGRSRQWNISNNALYIQSLAQAIVPFEIEELTVVQQINEYIMTALRTIEGIDANRINAIADNAIFDAILLDAAHYINEGLLTHANRQLSLSPKGKFMADGIAAHLFREE